MSPPYLRLIFHFNFVLWLMALSADIVYSQSLVQHLPGLPGKLPFKLETGYIGVGESEEIQLFYYFIESEKSPEKDPLLLWLQGGPGCSGFSGLVFEIGPLMFDYDNYDGDIPTLIINPNSWTKVSNVIFIDQPVGTGFSYSESSETYPTSDTLSAKQTYEFLRKWLVNHPKYLKNPLYIAGESYCGLLLPLVVDEIYNGIKAGNKPHLNMKGYILGNPITDLFVDVNGRVAYAHRMGFLSDELYRSAKENCKGNYKVVDPNNYLCKKDLERVHQCTDKIRFDQVLEPWCDMDSVNQDLLMHHMPSSSYEEIISRRSLESLLYPKGWCRPMYYLYSYYWANQKLVQEALHVREGTITEWVRCNRTLPHATYTNDVNSTVIYHKKFSDESNYRAIILSGDHDMTAPHSATEEWIRSLKLQIQSDWRPWFVEGQIAGYATEYFKGESKLTYATVKGAGHTAPEFKPLECLALIDRWLSNNPI